MNISPEKIAPPVAFVVVGFIMIVIGATGVVPVGNPQPVIPDPRIQDGFLIIGIIFVLLGPLFVLRETRTKQDAEMPKSTPLVENKFEIESENSDTEESLAKFESETVDSDDHLTGKWQQIIFKGLTQEVVKRDMVECKQVGELVEAEIFRVFPEDQKGRKWHFSGRFRKDKVFGHFWSDEKAAFSFGTIYLRETNRGVLQGNYVRASRYSQSWQTDKLNVQTIRLQWQKIE